ncbi:MAG: hypothetical protein ACI4VK_00940 [Candidatus Coproplasma sp.]
MAVSSIFIIAISVTSVIGAVIGIFKKATGLPFWGITVLLSILISWLVAKLVPVSGLYSWLVLGITVGSAILLTLFFNGVKAFINKRIERAKEYSHYKNADERAGNEEYTLNAVDKKDKKQYRKYSKKGRKIKDSSGGWGVFNRILGFIVGGVEWLVAVGSIICALLLFIDLSGITLLQENEIVQELLTSSVWTELGTKFVLDMLLVGGIVIAFKSGFNKGIFFLITPVVVIAMLGGFGYASWAIASSDACGGIVTSLQNGLLASLMSIDENLTKTIAMVIIAAVIFLLSLILVILVGIFLPKLIDKYRDNDAFYVIDGVLGAVVSIVLLLVVYIALGGIAYTINDLEFMAKFNSYEAASVFADAFYNYNPFAYLFTGFPLHDWFAYSS